MRLDVLACGGFGILSKHMVELLITREDIAFGGILLHTAEKEVVIRRGPRLFPIAAVIHVFVRHAVAPFLQEYVARVPGRERPAAYDQNPDEP